MHSKPDRHRRQEQVGAFFAAHDTRLRRIVARRISAPWELIQDACASAWTILLRRSDVTLDQRGFSWLTTVAINEALALKRRTRGETPVGTFQGDPHGHDDDDEPEPIDITATPAGERALERIEHTERVRAFAQLKPREREALYLHALGYSYQEIGRLTNSTYTAVNRRISEGRAALRGERRNRGRAKRLVDADPTPHEDGEGRDPGAGRLHEP